MIISYTISGPDNDSYMFDSDTYLGDCSCCNARLKQKVNENFILGKNTYDISYTYDDYLIVSQGFKDFCIKTKQNNLNFHTLKSQPNFYFMEATSILEFDSLKRETEFINKCDCCGVYEELIGATPAFLKESKEIIKEGIYRTDIEFGSKKNRGPLIIMGVETLNVFREQRFKGLEYRAINND
mgnify:CR=1 FL=1